MKKRASYCLTEPGAGSDAASLSTRAEHDGDGWRLTGQKQFISGAGSSDVYLVLARTGEAGPKGISCFLVPKEADGLSFGANEKKMGWNAQPTRTVVMDNVRVGPEALVGEENRGFRIAMAGLDGGRLNISACSLGGASAALNATVQYMSERRAFGQRLDEMQALQFRLADMKIELEAARSILWRAAAALDAKTPDASMLCAAAKRFVTDSCSNIADEALQLHGGYGYLAEYGIEKIVRDLARAPHPGRHQRDHAPDRGAYDAAGVTATAAGDNEKENEMKNIAFIGLGNMGGPMAGNLVKAGHQVTGFDVSQDARDNAAARGVRIADTVSGVAEGAEAIVTMLPNGKLVLDVWKELAASVAEGVLVIDSSTIDVESARAAHALMAGRLTLDAPVSGGTVGAEAGTLSFMLGGTEEAIAAATPILEPMAGRLVPCGAAGAGQAAKLCNNMLLGISMIGASEAFVLGEKLGLDPQALFNVLSTSTGQCWAVNTNCPVPGPVPTSPANRDYRPGFATALMLKDLRLAAQAATDAGAETPLGTSRHSPLCGLRSGRSRQ